MEVEIQKSGLANDCRIVIEEALNGYIVRGSSRRTAEDVEYVYDSWDKMKKNLDAVKSVLKQDAKQITEDDLDEEEERIKEDKEDY